MKKLLFALLIVTCIFVCAGCIPTVVAVERPVTLTEPDAVFNSCMDIETLGQIYYMDYNTGKYRNSYLETKVPFEFGCYEGYVPFYVDSKEYGIITVQIETNGGGLAPTGNVYFAYSIYPEYEKLSFTSKAYVLIGTVADGTPVNTYGKFKISLSHL